MNPKASDIKKNIKYGIVASEIKHENMLPPLIEVSEQSIASLNVVTSSIKKGRNKTPKINITIPIVIPKKAEPRLLYLIMLLLFDNLICFQNLLG